METCRTCRWWLVLQKEWWGKCKRYPPQVTNSEDTQPMTAPTDYCGEYAEAPANTPTADA